MRASERAPVRALNKITLKPDCLWLGNGREKVTEKEREWGSCSSGGVWVSIRILGYADSILI